MLSLRSPRFNNPFLPPADDVHPRDLLSAAGALVPASEGLRAKTGPAHGAGVYFGQRSLLLAFAVWVLAVSSAASAPSVPEELRRTVAALPAVSPADQAKRAVLEVALERAQASADAGMAGQAAGLLRDVEAALQVPAAAMANPTTADATHIAAIKPVPVTAGNPYLEGLTEWGNALIARPEQPWARATPMTTVMKGLAPREVGAEIRNAVWLYANPSSPLRGNGELLKRILRRGHAFIDAANLNAAPGTKAQTEIYDQFAAEEWVSGAVEFISLYPGLLLPSQRAEWDAGLRAASDRLWPEMKRSNNWNLNIETARTVAVLNLGYYYKNQEVIDRVLKHVDATISKMRPDGAFPYNGDSNPSCNYHGAIIGSLSRIYDITGYEPLARALAATQWKGPVMGRTDEFWTSPFHKTFRWNYERGTENANQLVITLSKNPYANGLRGKIGGPDRDAVSWFRVGIPTKPLPDNYTIMDRNVKGPRAWYGRFNYAATLHSKSPQENITGGHETLMGAMTVDDPGGRVNSILVNARPTVKVAREDVKDAKGMVQSSARAQLTANLRGVSLTGRHYSASAATYALTTTRGWAYQGRTTDWTGRQIWLGLPDRIIGLLSTVPSKEGAEAFEVNTVLRLISGGTAGAAVCKKLEKLADNRYRYGELDIVIHSSNFAAVTADVVEYRRKNFPASELTFRAMPAPRDPPEKFPLSANFHCVVEVRPVWAKGEAAVTATPAAPVPGLQATVNGKNWQIFFNPGTTPQACPPFAKPSVAGTSIVRVSDVKNGLPQPIAAPGLQLAPGQEAVFVTSPDPIDHLPGWDSFEQMVGATPTRR